MRIVSFQRHTHVPEIKRFSCCFYISLHIKRLRFIANQANHMSFAFAVQWHRLSIGKATALQWKGIGFAVERHRLCSGKATALHWKAAVVALSHNCYKSFLHKRNKISNFAL